MLFGFDQSSVGFWYNGIANMSMYVMQTAEEQECLDEVLKAQGTRNTGMCELWHLMLAQQLY